MSKIIEFKYGYEKHYALENHNTNHKMVNQKLDFSIFEDGQIWVWIYDEKGNPYAYGKILSRYSIIEEGES